SVRGAMPSPPGSCREACAHACDPSTCVARSGTIAFVPEYRASFDAAVTFLSGGGLSAQGFRLDVPGPEVTAGGIGPRFVRHLAVLMVERVDITNLEVFEEPHKGSRGVPVAAGGHRIVELNHVMHDGMITYPGLPGAQLRPYMTHEESRAHYAPGTEIRID